MEPFEFYDDYAPGAGGGGQQCPRHGRPLAFLKNPLTGNALSFCEACGSERDEAEVKSNRKREAQQQQAAINAAQDNAMLTPKFKSKTLETYMVKTRKQQDALNTAKWFLGQIEAEKPANLIFLGAPGTGKGHLAAGIINAWIANGSGRTALSAEAVKFIRAIKETWRKDGLSESDVLRRYREPDVLVLDELGVQFGSETEKLYITELINDRYSWLKSTILISNLSLTELTALIGQRAMDRLGENGKTVICNWESFRTGIKMPEKTPEAENQTLKRLRYG